MRGLSEEKKIMKIYMKGNYYFIHYAHHQDSASQYDLAFLRKNYLSLIFQDKKRLLAVFLFSEISKICLVSDDSQFTLFFFRPNFLIL